MSQKMTVSEFRQFIQEEVLKLYAKHLLESRKAKIEDKFRLLESIEVPETTDSISKMVDDEIEMRMRPTDSMLPYDEIIEIANEYNVEPEYVVHAIIDFIAKRDKEKEEDLKDYISHIIDTDFHGEVPDFKTFYQKFKTYEETQGFNTVEVESMYKSMTTDPNQMALFEKKINEIGFNQHGEPMGFAEDTEQDRYEKEIEGGNIYRNKYDILTVNKPIIPDVVKILERNPDSIKFTNKNAFIEFAEKQHYFSASHSHCFNSIEEYQVWAKEHIKTPDAEQSEMLFETGNQPVQVWDNKNGIGYIIPSSKLKKGLKEDWFEGESFSSDCMQNPEACMSKPSHIISRQINTKE